MAEVTLHPLAQDEYEMAVRWYQSRNRRAGERLARAIERLLVEIGRHPERYSWYDDEHREAPVAHYPYNLVYKVLESGSVLVVAVAHSSREPGFWQGRA